MNERNAFVRAILANPADRTARVVYADWLQEHGEELAARVLRDLTEPLAVREWSDGLSDRRRRFLVSGPARLELIETMAAAHALGVPVPGSMHPLYMTTCAGIYFSQTGPRFLLCTCDYQ